MNTLTIHLNQESHDVLFTDQVICNPGTVLQGSVKLKAATPVNVSRIRIVFHASEGVYISPEESHTAGPVRALHQQLFGTQHILWKADTSELLGNYEHPFTLEMPMVQFPPTITTMPNYRCVFKFTAYLEALRGQEYDVILKTQKEVVYQPFIETYPEKILSPLAIESSSGHPGNNMTASLKMDALHYRVGDTIAGSLHITSNAASPQSYLRVTAQLVQVATIRDESDNVYQLSPRVVAECKLQEPFAASKKLDLQITTPSDLPPTFTYSKFTAVRYKLCVVVKQTRKGFGGVLSSSPRITLDNVPINFGTLSYGVRAPSDLAPYSIFRSVFSTDDTPSTTSQSNRLMPLPKFLIETDDTDTLPAYESYQLPPYATTPPTFPFESTDYQLPEYAL